VQERYRTSININNELSEVKLILSQLLGIKLRFNSNDVKSLDGIKNIIVHVDNLQTQLSANYFANYKTVNDELNKVKEQVILLIQSSSLDETLKLFTKRIIFFLNKYRYEAKEIDEVLNMAEKYYIDGNFQDGIDLLIDVLVNIKESAKVNRITFN
jgi:septation ring formation regulator EzrA